MDNWDISEWFDKPGGLSYGWSYKAETTVTHFIMEYGVCMIMYPCSTVM